MSCNIQVGVKRFCYIGVHMKTVCLQLRTGHPEVISLLHRLQIVDWDYDYVTKKCPRFCTGTVGDIIADNSAKGI